MFIETEEEVAESTLAVTRMIQEKFYDKLENTFAVIGNHDVFPVSSFEFEEKEN
jgi:hypothetical protein